LDVTICEGWGCVLTAAALLLPVRHHVRVHSPPRLSSTNACLLHAAACCCPQAIRSNLQQEALQQLLREVEAVLDDDAQASQRCTGL
jgi:hypothetical protein